jgi:molybdate transport system ATP-binding protein
MSSIILQNVTIKNGQHNLLHGVNLTVNKGEHFILIGESGSGKSILLNTLAGKYSAANGMINMEAGKRVTLVASKHQFTDKTNTSTNLYYQQRFNSSDSDQAATVQQYLQQKAFKQNDDLSWNVERVVELLRLNNLLNKELIKLSNGETKRLRLASALLTQPMLLLLDDPLSGLDHQTQQDFNHILQQIIDAGSTVVMSGSGQEIPSPITHVAIMHRGSVVKTVAVKDYQPLVDGASQNINRKQFEDLTEDFTSPPYQWIVNMNSVTVKYNKHIILDKVDWQIKPGEQWALFGHNGAGKSTLLSLINGDNPQAYANDIILFDRKRGTGESIWDIKRNIGFLSPELYQYFPTDQSALQVVESGYYDTQGLFRLSNVTKAAKALQWLKVFGIEQYARQPLKNMPASAQRLCLLARALIKMPPLLILDEPCQGLDKQQRLHFNKIIDTIVELTGITLIYVTHYANELPVSIKNVLTLVNGRVAHTPSV